VVYALGGGIDVLSGDRLSADADFVTKGEAGFPLTVYPIPPLMHGASQWAVMGQSFLGNTIVLRANFDPAGTWSTVDAEGVNLVMITGDAMARPLVDELDANRSDYDLSSLFALSSSAVLFSQTCKDAVLSYFPNLVITDAIGSSESGANGVTMVSAGTTMKGGPTVTPALDAVVLDDELRPVAPGSGAIGRLARFGNVPVGYLNDPAKTAATFVTGPDGVRYSIPGDFAMVEQDGSITMLGRGSVSINTGGEKVFPEEVENVLKGAPGVFDATVVGVPDGRWGERVVAVVQARAGEEPELEAVQAYCRAHLAGYKLPRDLVVVETIVRSPAGKPDYRWARGVAADALTGGASTTS